MLNEAFFHWNTELGQINSRAFGVFSAKLSSPIFVQWVPCPCFQLFNPYVYKNYAFISTSQIFNWDLNLGNKQQSVSIVRDSDYWPAHHMVSLSDIKSQFFNFFLDKSDYVVTKKTSSNKHGVISNWRIKSHIIIGWFMNMNYLKRLKKKSRSCHYFTEIVKVLIDPMNDSQFLLMAIHLGFPLFWRTKSLGEY